MVLTNYPLSSFAVCLGDQARNANKVAKQNYELQLASRKRKWMHTLTLDKLERVQYDQTLDATHVGLGNAYAEIQEKYRDQIGEAMQADLGQKERYLQESAGGKAAAAGRTGRSIDRMQTADLAKYLMEGSNTAYKLTQSARDLGKKGAEAAGQARQAQLQAFANQWLEKSPELAPPPPVYQNVGHAAFMDALGIATSVASVATPFVAASSKKLKANLQLLGDSIAGHNIYKFNYKGDSRKYVGVLAEEVQQTNPEAVVTMPNGFLGVNYSLIDVNFHEVPA